MCKKIALFLLFCMSTLALSAQLGNVESSIPPGIHWQQINTDTVRVVFPKGMETRANRIANMVSYMNRNNQVSIGNKFRKVAIFLLDKTVVSNAYVAISPYHSKFFTKSPQASFGGTTDWLDLLSIHEYRHVMQFNNTLHGITKWMYYLGGEGFWGLMSGLAIPPWFWEGDAVVQETALSYSGRGRIADFNVSMRTIADQKRLFSYEKMVCGSYRDFVPSRYVLGYDLSLYGRQKFGNVFWRDVFKDAVSYRGILWPFSGAIKKKTGKRTNQLYKDMMAEKKGKVNRPVERSDTAPLFETYSSDKTPGAYRFPKFRNEEEIIAIQERFDKEAGFVSLKLDGNVENLIPVGFGMGHFDVYQSFMVWNEIESHPRWANVSYSNLYRYDFDDKKVRKMTRNKRYFSPAISPDGSRVLVVQSGELMKFQMLILDAKTGDIIQALRNEENYDFTYPVWISASEIAVIAKHESRNAILKINVNTNVYSTLIPFKTQLFEYLRARGDALFFQSNFGTDINQLFRYNLQTGKLQAANIRVDYLLQMPDIAADGKIAFVNTYFNHQSIIVRGGGDLFSDEGIDFLKNEQFTQATDQNDYYGMINQISEKEGGPIIDNISDKKNKVTPYKTGFRRLKLHAWLAKTIHPLYSLYLQSSNPLSTIGLSAEPGYNANEHSFYLNTNLTYGAYYPLFNLGMRMDISRVRNQYSPFLENKIITWNEYQSSFSIGLPHQFNRRHYYYSLKPALGYKYIQVFNLPDISDQSYHVISLSLSASAIRKKAYRDIKPKYSFETDLQVQKALNNGDKYFVASNSILYFPGFYKSHSSFVQLNFSYQNQFNEYYFQDEFSYPRGYGSGIYYDWIAGVKFNYALALFYPDFAIGPVAFVKRIRANLYFDVARYVNDSWTLDAGYQKSIGIELISDTRFFRMADLPIGIGFDYLFDAGQGRSPYNIRIVVDY